jgi:hypothetical protein
MANAFYTKAKDGLWGGDIAYDTDNIKAVLVDTASYTANLATDEFLSDIPVGARVATSSNLTSKTISGGAIDAADVVYSTVSGNESEAVVLYQDTAVEGTSRLIVYVDTATGLPVTPNGTDITVQWNASGIATL